MGQPRFLADHDLNEHIIDGVLRREPSLGFVRARDVGYAGRPDSEVLEYAAQEGLVVVSHDVNTMPAASAARLVSKKPFAGLLMVHQRAPVGRIIEDLILIWSASEAEEWHGLIGFLPMA